MDLKVRNSEEMPICPHCNKEVSEILKRKHGDLEAHVVYFCPHCKKILSIGYNYYS